MQISHMRPINLILIGLGAHATRVYYPIIEKYATHMNVRFSCIVDIKEREPQIREYLSKQKTQPDEILLLKEHERSLHELSYLTEQKLNHLVTHHDIHGVVISTEPLSHMAYVNWALKQGLSILMDKPVSLRKYISSSPSQARSLISDFEQLQDLYVEARRLNQNCIVSIMAQRRFHPAYIKIKALIREVFERTHCPITSICINHADGEWRTPEEIITQDNHPYNRGYGAFSHSGYHSIDMLAWLIEAAQDETKAVDNVEIFANFLKPADYITQITQEDLRAILGEKYQPSNSTLSDEVFLEKTKFYGEIDAFASLTFKRQENILTIANTSMIHNSFSQRDWISNHDHEMDISKKNGRVRHESYLIQQGPFQSIKLSSFKNGTNEESYSIGGEYHLDIDVFRNHRIFPDWKNMEHFSFTDLVPDLAPYRAMSHQSVAKQSAVVEFLCALRGEISRSQIASDLLTHRKSMYLLSGMYQSAASGAVGENPIKNVYF